MHDPPANWELHSLLVAPYRLNNMFHFAYMVSVVSANS